MHNGIRHIKHYRKRKEKTKRILITKERTKKLRASPIGSLKPNLESKHTKKDLQQLLYL